MRHTILVSLVVVLLGTLAAGVALAGSDVLRDYKKRFDPDEFLSKREQVLKELEESEDPKAVAALEWCAGVSRKAIGKAADETDKARKKLEPVAQRIEDFVRKIVEKALAEGREPPKQFPVPPDQAKYLELESALLRAEKVHKQEVAVLKLVLESAGRLVARLPEEEQRKVRDEWKKSPLGDKDWQIRADGYEQLAHTPAPWALEMLLSAALSEPDPRVLVRIVAGLGGKDPAIALPVLSERTRDSRWLVRAAAIEALERTPAKETIDLLIEVMAKEEGRLLEDCGRALKALTGQEHRHEAAIWKAWWAENREQWTGPPPKVEEPKGFDPTSGLSDKAPERDDSTGFFGIETRSKRLAYVIDVSGSMHANVGDTKASGSRAEKAKEELKRAIGILEDGALFNIVFYSNTVKAWKDEMVVSGPETRAEALAFIDQMSVAGGTATYEALKFAFELGDVKVKGGDVQEDPTGDSKLDTIILLSDGEPTVGAFTKPDEIRERVKQWNESRRITLHAVAFGQDANKAFMEGLAKDNSGTYQAR